MNQPHLTVGQLIDVLKTFPADALVWAGVGYEYAVSGAQMDDDRFDGSVHLTHTWDCECLTRDGVKHG